MSEHEEREDRAVLEALAVLEAETPDVALGTSAEPGVETDEADARETLRRLYAETLGLLAYASEPAAPAVGARERLLAALDGEDRGGGAAQEREAEVTPLAAWAAAGPAPSRPRRIAPWLAAVAAVLLFAAVGLAGLLWLELDAARASLARLEADRTRLAERLDAQEDLIRRVGGSGELLAAMATPGVEVCPLRPVGDPPMMPRAYAVLYMPPGSGEWYLLASNLEPDRGVYRVWVNTPDGAVPMGVLKAGKAATLELRLPPALDERHDLMQSITVTLEPSPDLPEPEGPMVLLGDERMTIL